MSVTSRTTEITLAPAEPIGTSSAPICSASTSTKAGGRVRLTAMRGRSLVRGGTTGGSAVLKVVAIPGWATAPATRSPSSQSATWIAQSSRGGSEYSRVPSSGSTIQTRSLVEPDLVVLALLAEDGVVGAVGRRAGCIKIAWPSWSPASFSSRALEALAAQLLEPLAGHGRRPGREPVVVGQRRRRAPGATRVRGVGHG